MEKNQYWWQKIPYGVIMPIIIQTIFLVAYIASFQENTKVTLQDHERRILRNESNLDKSSELISVACQRLAKVEEGVSSVRGSVNRIEDMVSKHMENSRR